MSDESVSDSTPATAARPPWDARLSAFLAFKFGKRPSDSLLDYMAEFGPNEALRREAARLLAKRNAHHE